jgi:predicted O-methyltransferase YrrM
MMFDADNIRTPAAYARILRGSVDLQFQMNSDLQTGALLRLLARSKPAGRFLELGTGCGLGTCWLLDGMTADSRLVSVDIDAPVQDVARTELGGDHRLELVTGDGAAFLEACGEDFDLVYADTWPGKYTHLDAALARVKPGGIYLVDDMLPQPNWPDGHAQKAQALLGALDHLADFDVVKLAWSTGIVICARRTMKAV